MKITLDLTKYTTEERIALVNIINEADCLAEFAKMDDFPVRQAVFKKRQYLHKETILDLICSSPILAAQAILEGVITLPEYYSIPSSKFKCVKYSDNIIQLFENPDLGDQFLIQNMPKDCLPSKPGEIDILYNVKVRHNLDILKAIAKNVNASARTLNEVWSKIAELLDVVGDTISENFSIHLINILYQMYNIFCENPNTSGELLDCVLKAYKKYYGYETMSFKYLLKVLMHPNLLDSTLSFIVEIAELDKMRQVHFWDWEHYSGYTDCYGEYFQDPNFIEKRDDLYKRYMNSLHT